MCINYCINIILLHFVHVYPNFLFISLCSAGVQDRGSRVPLQCITVGSSKSLLCCSHLTVLIPDDGPPLYPPPRTSPVTWSTLRVTWSVMWHPSDWWTTRQFVSNHSTGVFSRPRPLPVQHAPTRAGKYWTRNNIHCSETSTGTKLVMWFMMMSYDVAFRCPIKLTRYWVCSQPHYFRALLRHTTTGWLQVPIRLSIFLYFIHFNSSRFFCIIPIFNFSCEVHISIIIRTAQDSDVESIAVE